MKKVLLVKMSSMGDVLHTLPALTDAQAALPGLRFDWVVEEAFAEIPAWHAAVDRVIPVAFRRWRKTPLSSLVRDEWRAARLEITRDKYDRVIDAQGLLKSAVVTRIANGRRCGMDRQSAREGLASLAYDDRIPVPRAMHAVERIRMLLSRALDYPLAATLPATEPDFALAHAFKGAVAQWPARVWFLHGTAREEKCWPEHYWLELARQVLCAGHGIAMTWGNSLERDRAQRIASGCATEFGEAAVQILPRPQLSQLAAELSAATAVVAVDTGLGHLSAALGVPGVSLYGGTDPILIGTCGAKQVHLCSGQAGSTGSMSDIAPLAVWTALQELLPPRRATVSGGINA